MSDFEFKTDCDLKNILLVNLLLLQNTEIPYTKYSLVKSLLLRNGALIYNIIEVLLYSTKCHIYTRLMDNVRSHL